MRTCKIQPGGEILFYTEIDSEENPIETRMSSGVLDIIDSQKEFVLPLHYSSNSIFSRNPRGFSWFYGEFVG